MQYLLRVLELTLGTRLLDIACGIGRHSRALAAHGFAVCGIDYTSAYLQKARETPTDAHFLRGDMRRLPFRNAAFDAAINLFTSFGYFEDDRDNHAALHEMARVLRPGGRLLLDIQNRDGIAQTFQAQGWSEIPGGYLLEDRHWDCRNGRTETTWTFVRQGKNLVSYRVSVRVYTCTEIERMLDTAGLDVIEIAGSWEGDPLTMDSRRQIVTARKRG